MQNDNQDKLVSLANLTQALLGVKEQLYKPATYSFYDITMLTNEEIDTLIDSVSVGDIIIQTRMPYRRLKVIGRGHESSPSVSYHIIAAGTDGIYRINKIGTSYGYTYSVTLGNCYTAATASETGLMSSYDKTKLDNLNRYWTVEIGSVWPHETSDSFGIQISYGGEVFSSSNVHIGDTITFSGEALSNSNFVVAGRAYVCFHKAGSVALFIGAAKDEGFVVIEADVVDNTGDITAKPLVSKTLASNEADGLMSAADKRKLDESIIVGGYKTLGKFTPDTTPTQFGFYDMSDFSYCIPSSYSKVAFLLIFDDVDAVFVDVNDISKKYNLNNWKNTAVFTEGTNGWSAAHILPDVGIQMRLNAAELNYHGEHSHKAEDITDLPKIIIQ